VVPVGRSGIAFLGDRDKLVTLGRQRIAQLRDDGAVTVTVQFARGERGVTLRGYAPRQPALRVLSGTGRLVSYSPGSGLFDVRVGPGPREQAGVRLTLPPLAMQAHAVRRIVVVSS
jgi:hypothetical protein